MKQFEDRRLITGSNLIKIWNVSLSVPLASLKHGSTVYAVEIINEFTIATGGIDKSIKIWDIRS